LSQEQQDQDRASHTDNGRLRDISVDLVQSLDCAKNRLRWGEDSIGDRHRHCKDTYCLQKVAKEGRLLDCRANVLLRPAVDKV
jgi:hypothetical protein